MLSQHNPPSTPLWIPYMEFDTKEECINFVQVNQNGLFLKAYQEYDMKIPPQSASCVDEEMFKKIQTLMKQGLKDEINI